MKLKTKWMLLACCCVIVSIAWGLIINRHLHPVIKTYDDYFAECVDDNKAAGTWSAKDHGQENCSDFAIGKCNQYGCALDRDQHSKPFQKGATK